MEREVLDIADFQRLSCLGHNHLQAREGQTP